MLCSVGAIHALVTVLKPPLSTPTVLKAALSLLLSLHKFDSKLVSVVVRLQGGISAILEALRENLHSGDGTLLQALLLLLQELSSSAQNALLVAKDNGIAVLLACILAHIKDELLLLPALGVLVSLSRTSQHVGILVREGGVPALLAAMLAHLRKPEVLRAALSVLRNAMADESAAQRLNGQGATRIIYAVLQTHCSAEQLELLRLASAVLWRMQLLRCPADETLHAELVLRAEGSEVSKETREGKQPKEAKEAREAKEGGREARGLDASSSSSDDEATRGRSETSAEGIAAPTAVFRLGGHDAFIDAAPPPEPLSADARSHASHVARAIVSEAERLVSREPNGLPRVVYDAFAPDCHAHAAEDSLRFDAQFESGNLRRVVQVAPFAYDLVLSCDVNTRGHTQWFFFRVRNMSPRAKYRIAIVNMMKPDSLFSAGMRPLLYSTTDAARGVGWVRCGENVCYFANQYTYVPTSSKKKKGSGAGAREAAASYYTLSFSLKLPHADDTVYLAQCYPYTYSMLRTSLADLGGRSGGCVRRETLTSSVGGHVVELLTVTDFGANEAEIRARKVAVVSARVHPGESNASWMMQGLLDAVTSNSVEARDLRRHLVLKIVPMLNPDGVILGNYRCGLAGLDLNRQWSEPLEAPTPTIFHLKRMMRALAEQDQLLLFCDLHGHSRKPNIFTYGCEGSKNAPRFTERIFPTLLADCAHFSLAGCSYKVLRSKETCGRVVVWRQLGLAHSFTLEASFCGADFGDGAAHHFNTSHFKQMGAAFVPALLALVEPSQARVSSILAELEASVPSSPLGSDEEDVDDDESTHRRRAVSRGRRAAKPAPPVPSRRKPAEAATKKKKKPASASASASASAAQISALASRALSVSSPRDLPRSADRAAR